MLKSKFAKAKNLLDEKRRHRWAIKGQKDRKKQNVLMKATGWMKGEQQLLLQRSSNVYISKAAALRTGREGASTEYCLLCGLPVNVYQLEFKSSIASTAAHSIMQFIQRLR